MDASTHEREAEERAQFMLLMRARGVNDLRVLRALERAPRSRFMPRRYSDIAARDIALPIGCGQTAPPPSAVAAMIEALDLAPGSRVLEIGTGSGYSASLMAQIAAEILTVERCQSLALEAAERLAAFGHANVRVRFDDGLALREVSYDRVLVHALLEPPAQAFLDRLAPGGILVAALAEGQPPEQRILRIRLNADREPSAEAFGLVRTFTPLAPGLARGL